MLGVEVAMDDVDEPAALLEVTDAFTDVVATPAGVEVWTLVEFPVGYGMLARLDELVRTG